MTTDEDCKWEGKFFLSYNLLIIITSFSILVGFLAAFGNILVLLSIYRKPSLRSSHSFFIGSLAVADLSVASITMPMYASGALTWPFLLKNDFFEMVLDFLVFQTLSASSLSLCAVSYDRFLAITSPMKYTLFMTKAKIEWTITVIWATSVIIGCLSFVVTGYEIRPSIYLAVVFTSFVLPFAMIAYFYSRIFKVARNHAKQISIQENISSSIGNPGSGESSEQQRTVKHEHKAAITIAIVIGTFAVCWLPNLVIGVVHFAVSRYSKCEAEKIEQFWLITIPFALINSAVNPMIYAARNEEFRRAFKELLRF